MKILRHEQTLLAAYEKYYAKAPFVRYSAASIPEIKNVAHTNFIDIGFRVDQESGQIVVLSAIDNLVKALQDSCAEYELNVRYNETEGIK